MVQVPLASSATVVPPIMQTSVVEEVKLTGRPEVAVADTTTLPPTNCAAMGLKLMVWEVPFTAKLRYAITPAYVRLPGWNAAIRQLPTTISDAVVPDTVQTLGVEDVKLTGRPEVAVAVRATVFPICCVGIVPKVMVWEAKSTAKLWETGAAAAYAPLPACVAVIVQRPTSLTEAVVPDTVQVSGVVEVKLTGRPELAVADRTNVLAAFWVAIMPKVMLWGAALTAKLCAASDAPLPVAVMVQVPGAINAAVAPDTVQTAGVFVTKLTGTPELAVAKRATVPPTVCAGMGLKVMLWEELFTAKLCQTPGAAL